MGRAWYRGELIIPLKDVSGAKFVKYHYNTRDIFSPGHFEEDRKDTEPRCVWKAPWKVIDNSHARSGDRPAMAAAANRSAYAKAGVDIEKADRFVGAISKMVGATLNPNVAKSIGGYAALYQTRRQTSSSRATTDGVGTKLKLAFELGRHDTVGIDLVAMSVNDLICVGAKPLFFLDYFATGKLDLKTLQGGHRRASVEAAN